MARSGRGAGVCVEVVYMYDSVESDCADGSRIWLSEGLARGGAKEHGPDY